MSKEDIISEMKKLIELIDRYNYHYYTLDNPIVSDKEYDEVYYKLVDLEKDSGIVLPNSPTQRVGGVVLDKFQKHKHEHRLYSLSKVRDFEDLEKWASEMWQFDPDTAFALEYKYDGLQLVLEYDGGKFVRATTRGNGEIGEDVTLQVKTISSVPLHIEYNGKLIVQGEGMMTRKALEIYNRKADIPLKNARNGAAGAIRNLDTKETAKRKLNFFCYSVIYCDKEFNTQEEIHKFLIENHFDVGFYFKVCKTVEELVKRIKEVDKIKSHLDIDIDGMVIKVNNLYLREKIGYTNKFPKWTMAYKFEAQEVTTVIKDVVWQVGRSGRVTPIALLEPVELAGATVKRATLNNIEDIRRKDVYKKSRVFVRRSNEVIPEVMGLAEKVEGSEVINEPELCPCCQHPLEKVGPLIYCVNHYGCKDQVVDRLSHFASRNAFNIEGLSEKTAGLFYDALGVRTLSDIYDVKYEDLLKLDKFKEKKAKNTINSIINSKKIELNRFLYALGISEVGSKTAKDLASHFGSLQNLMKASVEELSGIRDVGEIIAVKIREFFDSSENLSEINRLFSHGVEIINPVQVEGDYLPFLNKTVVLTGTLENFARSDAEGIIERLGGRTTSSVSKQTDYVLVGANPGSKYDKAISLGLKVLTEADFIKIIDRH